MKFLVYKFENGMLVVDHNDEQVRELTGRFTFWRWLKIWWYFRDKQ